MPPVNRELAALRFLDGLGAHLKDVREPHKALRHTLRDTREFFQATDACIATLHAGRPEADLLFTLPKHTDWDLGVLARYIRHPQSPVQRRHAVGLLRRRGGAWGAIALIRPDVPTIGRIGACSRASRRRYPDAIHRIDRDRLLGVRDRIDRKIMEQIHPKDLFYQILDGIRSLTHYDHSSALLIREEDEAALRVVAEQIAWTKAKSPRIGLRLPITDEAAALLQSEQVYGFDRHGTAGRHGRVNQGTRRRPRLPRCSITTATTRARAKRSGKGRCCARRWSRATASSVCSRSRRATRSS